MREQTGRKPGRFNKSGKRKGGGRKNRYAGGPNDNRVNGGNDYRNGNSGETGVCIKCGHPAADGKLCSFHRSLLNTFRKENPEQDPRRNKFW